MMEHEKQSVDDLQKVLISEIFDEIATIANAVGDSLSGIVTEHGEVASEAYLLSKAVEQIGWLADLGGARMNGASPNVKGGAEEWLLPPSYHSAKAQLDGLAGLTQQ